MHSQARSAPWSRRGPRRKVPTYRRTILIDGDPGVLELLPGADDDQLVVHAHLPHWDELIHIVDRVRRIGSLDLDLAEPTAHLADQTIVGPLLRAPPVFARREPGMPSKPTRGPTSPS
jgi:hypothetical protein